MNRAILALTLTTLSACSTPLPQTTLAEPRSILPPEYVSPDTALLVRFHVHPRQSYSEFLDHSTNTRCATAQSRIVADDFFEGRFRGTQDVVFASDHSGAVITENVSDASQSFRHILVSRAPNGSFTVRYLQPPWRRFTKAPVEFTSEPPIAIALTSDRITFYYPSSHSRVTLRLAQVPSTITPHFDPNE